MPALFKAIQAARIDCFFSDAIIVDVTKVHKKELHS